MFAVLFAGRASPEGKWPPAWQWITLNLYDQFQIVYASLLLLLLNKQHFHHEQQYQQRLNKKRNVIRINNK